jgi:glycosyltransferase involved in cell wall biosynthesis
MRSAVYAGNLHHGGGATGASIFFDDLPRLYEEGHLDPFERLEVVASTFVLGNMSHSIEVDRLRNVSMIVRDDHPNVRAAFWRSASSSVALDSEMIVRGPHYLRLRAIRTILGFADGSMYFRASRTRDESFSGRLAHEAANVLKRRILPRYDEYVVQTARLAARLELEVPQKPLWVVPNSPSPIFGDPASWRDVGLPRRRSDSIRLFYPARGYAHKNHVFIGSVGRLLEKRYGVHLDVVVTLRESEFAGLDPDTKSHVTNVGEVLIDQCPALYQDCDGVFFPSLNETFSVTPLEGMLMRRPVFASDRPFVRETAGDTPFYFDPEDSLSAADVIAEVFLHGVEHRTRLERGLEYVRSLPSSYERSRAYLRILRGESVSCP